MTLGPILIEFAGDASLFLPTGPVTFGRNAGTVDIGIDESNPFLHRAAGLIAPNARGWELHNVGERMRLILSTDMGGAFDLAPGTSVALPGPGGSISFTAGKCPYELRYATSATVRVDHPEPAGPKTSNEREVLTPMQRGYLACYARIMIHEGRTPQRAEIAARMGRSIKTVDAHVKAAKERAVEAGLADSIRSLEDLVRILHAHGVFKASELLPPDAR